MPYHRIVATDKFIQICGIVQGAFSEFPIHKFPVKVMDWKKVIEKRLSKHGKPPYSITISSFEPLGQIVATFLRYENKAEISFASTLHPFWQRYIVTKELAHLLIDTPKDYTETPSAVIAQIIAGIPLVLLRESEESGDSSYQSEKLACIAAIEMLLPWRFRDEVQNLQNKGNGPQEIGAAFEVPPHIVSNLLHLSYKPLSEIANTTAEKAASKKESAK
jgi:hypothetical protein